MVLKVQQEHQVQQDQVEPKVLQVLKVYKALVVHQVQ